MVRARFDTDPEEGGLVLEVMGRDQRRSRIMKGGEEESLFPPFSLEDWRQQSNWQNFKCSHYLFTALRRKRRRRR